MTRASYLRMSIFAVAAMVHAIGMIAMSGTASANQPTGFVCTFDAGTIRTYENGAFKTKAAETLSFTIGDINLRAQNAALITKKGKGGLKIVRAIGANHYLEVVTEGFLNITTIYETADVSKGFPAVHSRHFGLLGMPVVSQYHGICKLN